MCRIVLFSVVLSDGGHRRGTVSKCSFHSTSSSPLGFPSRRWWNVLLCPPIANIHPAGESHEPVGHGKNDRNNFYFLDGVLVALAKNSGHCLNSAIGDARILFHNDVV